MSTTTHESVTRGNKSTVDGGGSSDTIHGVQRYINKNTIHGLQRYINKNEGSWFLEHSVKGLNNFIKGNQFLVNFIPV
jgi:hypothetical protein